MGTPTISAEVLRKLLENKIPICAVVSQPDKPLGRGLHLEPTPVKKVALEFGLPVFQPQSLSEPAFLASLKDLDIDLSLVFAFRMLPVPVLQATRSGAINLHTSLLPKYRGAAPVPWALYQGEAETGATVFLLDPQMDHGKILGQKSTQIHPEENAGELLNRLIEELGLPLLFEVIKAFETGTLTPWEQDHTLACPARKLSKEDGILNWNKDEISLHNQVRAFNPFPICTTAIMEAPQRLLRVHKSKVFSEIQIQTGYLVRGPHGQALVGCKQNCLELLEVQWPGKPKISGKDLLNGLQGKGPWKLV